jgi:hypothetical protein
MIHVGRNSYGKPIGYTLKINGLTYDLKKLGNKGELTPYKKLFKENPAYKGKNMKCRIVKVHYTGINNNTTRITYGLYVHGHY